MNTLLGISNRARRLTYRSAMVAASVVLVFFSLLPRLAFSLENWQVESNLNNRLDIEVGSGGSEYLYTKPAFLVDGSEGQKTAAAQLFLSLTQSHKDRLGDPVLVPIGVDGITIFVPHYRVESQVGNAFVEQRLIRSQVTAQLSRQLIDVAMYGDTEQSQLSALYANARQYLLASDKNFGERLSDEDDISVDMVWPEFREIEGERVLVPILYLTEATRERQTVTDVAIEFSGEQITFKSMSVRLADIRLRRNAFLRISEDLVLHEASITADGDLNLSVGEIPEDPGSEVLNGVAKGTLSILSGKLTAQGNINIAASQMVSKTLVHAFKDEFGQGQRLGEIASIDSKNGDISIRSFGDILVSAGEITASSGAIRMDADGEIKLLSERYGYSSSTTSGEWQTNRSVIDVAQSRLTAEQSIDLLASRIELDAAEIASSTGHIRLLGQMGVHVLNAQSERQSNSSGKWGHTSAEEQAYITVAIRSVLDAGKGIIIESDAGDIELRAVDFTSQDGTSLSAGRNINLLMATEHDHYNFHSVTENLVRTKNTSRGHSYETGIPNAIVGGLSVEAVSGLSVEYKGDPDTSLSDQLNMMEDMPGMEWMRDLRSGGLADIDWALVEDQYDTWSRTDRALSPAAVALISIAVAVAVGPGAMDLGSLVMGSATGTTATVGSAAIAGGITSLASQSAVITSNAVLNGETDLYEIQKDIFTEETMINVATAMTTAAALSYLDAAFFDEIDVEELAQRQGVSVDQANTGWFRDAQGRLNLRGQASHAVAEATTRSAIQVLAEGNSLSQFGDDFKEVFEDNLKSVSVSRLGEMTYGAIAEAEFDTSIEYIVLAGSGCVLGALSGTDSHDGSNCYSGAGGAVIGKYVGDRVAGDEPTQEELSQLSQTQKQWLEENGIRSLEDYRQLQNGTLEDYEKLSHSFHRDRFVPITNLQRKGVNIARLSSGLMALIAGGNVDIAAEQAYFSVSNNVALAQRAYVLQGVNLLEDYQRLLPLIELQEKLAEAGTEQQVIQLIAEFSRVNPEYAYLKELSAHEALSSLFSMVSDAGYAQEFTGLLGVRYHRLALTSEALPGDEVDRMVRHVINDPTSTSYWELRAAATSGDVQDEIYSAIDRGFAQRFGVSECGAVGACVEASALFKSLLLMSGGEDLTGSAQAFFTEVRPSIEVSGDPDLLKAFDSAFGYFSAASEILVEGGAGIAQITEMSASAVLMLVDMSVHAVTGSEDTKSAYIHGLQVAVDVADTTQFLWQHRALMPTMAKDAWDDYSRQIEEAEAHGDWLTAEKLRSKRAYYVATILFPAARMGSGYVVSIGRVPSLQERFPDLTPNELALLKSSDTFSTQGVTTADADRFLSNTPEGRKLLEMMESQLPIQEATRYAHVFVESGISPPVMKSITSPLVKVVPTGETLSGHTGFWTTESQLRSVIASGQPFADAFGLPAVNHNVRYGVFEITPRGTAVVFESVVAPTSELGGKVTTNGGAVQIIVPDRRQFNEPVLVEVITSN